ncbi:hypothetical protein ACFSTC_62965 [Nonomuraea ferruginea]
MDRGQGQRHDQPGRPQGLPRRGGGGAAAPPSVRDAAVAGVPDRRLGEVPCAWIVPVDGEVDEGQLTAWCREHLAPYKVPVSFVAVDAMPRNDVGKVLRRQLRTSAPPKEVML